MVQIVNFDYAEWQARMGLSNDAAAVALDISKGMFCKLKRDGKGRKVYAWAAYGREAYALKNGPQ